MRIRPGVIGADQHDAGLGDVEHGEVAALRRHVQPAQAGIDGEHVGAGTGRAERHRVCAAQVDAREQTFTVPDAVTSSTGGSWQ